MKVRKDAKPTDTIKRIRKILKLNSIKVKEKNSFNVLNKIFSVRLELENIQNLGVNGKGFTKNYALASAYGELMERLQSRLIIKPYFTDKISNTIYFKDEFLLSYDKFKKEFSKLLSDKIINLTKEEKLYRVCTNFEDILTGNTKILPIRIINMLTHSNGLCAGNTYEEAISQGICEVFERYCYRDILFNEVKLPTINNIGNTNSFLKLENLKKIGFSYSVKDCSLGKFPVVGLILFNMDKSKYLFSIGSDPDFDIALQRCISEMFQGLNIETFRKKMKDVENDYVINKKEYKDRFVNLNWLRSYTSNDGLHPISILSSNTNSAIEKLPFNKNTTNNKESLKFLIKIIKNNDLEVYIKDYSFLGFPTYKVYIPGLSEIDMLEDYEFDIMANNNQLLKIYYNLPSTKESEINNSINILLEMAVRPKYSDFVIPSNFFNLHSFIDTNIKNITYFDLLILLLLKHKKYLELENICLDSEFLYRYKDSIEGIYHIINETDKDKRNLLCEEYLGRYSLPLCPDCKECKCSNKCKFSEWLFLHELLNEKYNEWIDNKNVIKKALENIFLKKVKPELTQCRIIQIDSNKKEGLEKNDRL